MMDHFDRSSILSDSQHGFIFRLTCETQLVITIDDIARAIDESGQVETFLQESFRQDSFLTMNNTLNNNTRERELLALSTTHIFLLWTLCVVAVFAIVQHSVILFLTTKSKTLRKKPFVVSILLLSMSDLLQSLGLFLVSCIHLAALRQAWICGLSYLLQQLGLVLSLVHTLFICTEQYFCTRPIQMETFSVRKRQALAAISTGICSPILGMPYLFTVRSANVLPCKAVTLFQENKSYALAPVRSITFLIWICMVITYALTAKNLRYSLRRTDRLRGGHSQQINRIRVAEMHHGNTSLPCSSTGQTNIGTKADVSVKPKTQKWYSNEHLNENNTNAPDDIIVKTNVGRTGRYRNLDVQPKLVNRMSAKLYDT
ncbi:uncharacterized protein [Argopecten irradians]|uniref:uncharacterized protein n=1 Tax=Argopecten irradians TaxID=31199 RepID=UPI00371322E8